MGGLSQVPRIQLNEDGTISLAVSVYGFEKDTPVEISGQATQENGAIASFYSIIIMPEVKDEESVTVTVDSVPVSPPKKFVSGFSITVVARAAESWITTLVEIENSENAPALAAPLGTGRPKAMWSAARANSATSAFVPASLPKEPSADSTLLRHGTWWDRTKADPLPDVMEGRFTRLFPDLPGARFKHDDLRELARLMIAPAEQEPIAETGNDPEENPGVAAAYTYLGQFVDHDLTFDPISQLRDFRTPVQLRALVDFRTPRFDLDNLYGRGPDDQPYMYDDDGICLLPGEPMSGDPFDPGAVQLPRGPNGRALIGDPRNDENRIVAQLHAIFLRFHNEVVRELGGKKHVSFREARQQVRWHYQWMLVTDFLPTIMDKVVYDSVFLDPCRPVTTIPRLREHDLELMPVEFSVAAYRFGHSMIRSRYQLNPAVDRPIFSGDPGDDADLGGFRPIPKRWAIDWQFFIKLGHAVGSAAENASPDQDAGKLQLSYKIDTSLVHPLGQLPARIARDPSNLAQRNLERGAMFQLPSGQTVATALGLPVIADEDLLIGKAIADSDSKPITAVAPGFAGNAPLWAYILAEARVASWKDPRQAPPGDDVPVKLGPVGGRLVAEVFASLLRGDPTSYLQAEHGFEPIPGFGRGRTFGLADLINVALRDKR